MANYLITGGCGFIGSHLAERLINEGHYVRIIDDLSTGKRSNVPAQCEIVVGDVADEDAVRACMQDMDGCFHLAAVSSVQKSNEQWLMTHRVNQTGSINILNAAKERKTPVVYASSAAVYGDNADTPLKENSTVRPLTAYGADKLATELHARVASVVHGVPTTGLRFFNVYGPRQDPSSPYSGVISIFVDRILAGKPVTIYGDGEQMRDFVFVEDVVEFLCTSMVNSNLIPSVFNVCTGESVSISQLAKVIMSITGISVPIIHENRRKGDILVSIGDPRQSKKLLDLAASHPLGKGLKTLVDYESPADHIYEQYRCEARN